MLMVFGIFQGADAAGKISDVLLGGISSSLPLFISKNVKLSKDIGRWGCLVSLMM